MFPVVLRTQALALQWVFLTFQSNWTWNRFVAPSQELPQFDAHGHRSCKQDGPCRHVCRSSQKQPGLRCAETAMAGSCWQWCPWASPDSPEPSHTLLLRAMHRCQYWVAGSQPHLSSNAANPRYAEEYQMEEQYQFFLAPWFQGVGKKNSNKQHLLPSPPTPPAPKC